MLVPWELQQYLESLQHEYPGLPPNLANDPFLIPLHEPSKHDINAATIPSLRDTAAESGNLRYWLLTNENMWQGQHAVWDEVNAVMQSLATWFTLATDHATSPEGADDPITTDTEMCLWNTANLLRRRIVLPELPEGPEPYSAVKPGLLSLREALLFRSWAFQSPAPLAHGHDDLQPNEDWHPIFPENYTFSDELFWEEGDEGEWVGEGAPVWH